MFLSKKLYSLECGLTAFVGDGHCQDITNNAICDYDGDDCCNENSYFVCVDCTCFSNLSFVPPPPSDFLLPTDGK